jgi:hypothetical protein
MTVEQTTTDALQAAAGHTLTTDELAGITARVDAAIHDLEAEDPAAWQALPIDERIARAGELAQTRHKAAVLAGQRQQIDRLFAAPLEIPPERMTSSAVLNGYVPPVQH